MAHNQTELIYKQTLKLAESLYDRVIQRWGNRHFAKSCVYDWVWSENFLEICCGLDERETGRLRVYILESFQVKPWPWHPMAQIYYPHSEL